MLQRLHPGIAPIDVLTREEMDTSLHSAFDDAIRTRYRGIDAAQIPRITAQGNGGTIYLGANITQGSDGNAGPEQGDVWMLRRAIVASSAFLTDNAKYILFKGTTPSDPAAYNSNNILDGQAFNAVPGTMTAPAVPASGVAVQNTTSQPYTVVITGGTVTGVSVNGIVVGGGDGTYVVPPYGSISITYSVAPTWTWTATSSVPAIGQNVNLAYNPGNKACLFQPGVQLFALVINSLSGASYSLTGEAIRVPAEMKGKVL